MINDVLMNRRRSVVHAALLDSTAPDPRDHLRNCHGDDTEDWTPRMALCAIAAVTCADSLAVAGVGSLLHRDGFETPEPQELVLDAVNRSSGIRVAAAEYWNANLQLPPSLDELGFDDPYLAGTALATLQSGVLTLSFEGVLAGESLAFAAWLQAGSLRWVCAYALTPVDANLQSGSTSAAQTTLPEALLPEACRSDPSLESQIQDVLRGMASARAVITESWMGGGTLPVTLADAGMQDPLPVAQARLQIVDGVLVANFVGDLDGKRLGVAPWEVNDTMVWVCGHAEAPPGATALASSTASKQTTIDLTLLPAWCR